ncbi:FAS1 domain-containing protein [Sporodiniella umbellata]|nr:FAS1 domain-containing protein [Sporodiniella umbellata]
MLKKQLSFISFLFWLIYLTPLCAGGIFGSYLKEHDSLFDIISQDERFHRLAKEIERYELVDHFKSIEAGTVFAPVNEAFEQLDLQRVRASPEQILYHVIPIAIESRKLWDGRLLETQATSENLPQFIKISKSTFTREITIGTGLKSNGAKVVDADIEATNGRLHAIDHLLQFPVDLMNTLALEDDISEFKDWADQAALDNKLDRTKGYTIFATKESVFGDKLSDIEKSYLDSREGRHDLARILTHQIAPEALYTTDLLDGRTKVTTLEGSEDLDIVVDGHTITVNGVKVIKTDLLASNGVIHVLEKPILPKKSFIELTTRKVLYALHASRFIKLLEKHDLGGYLDQEGPLTILAPSDDRLDDARIPTDEIKTWLQYHLIQGYYASEGLYNGQLLKTESNQGLGNDRHQRLRVSLVEQDLNLYRFPFEGDQIQFGQSSVLGKPTTLKGDKVIVYSISSSLNLPRDTLSLLPVNLELSTFVATLYASGADKTLQEAHGITLFSPTNAAFARLGLLTQFLFQPESREKLEQVVRYHAVRGVFYENSTQEGEHQVSSLVSGLTLTLNKTENGLYVRGDGALDGNDRSVIAKVQKQDLLTSSGVIHTIDRVQLPKSLEVSNKDLLSLEGTTQILRLLKRSNLTRHILHGPEPYTILAPTDRALAKINLSELKTDNDKLLAFAKLHILPVAFPPLNAGEIKDRWWTSSRDNQSYPIGYTGQDFPTLIKDTVLVISKNIAGGYSVKVKGNLLEGVDIVDLGRSSAGGGVLKIDRVLTIEKQETVAGWKWWQIALTVLGSILGLLLLALALYFLWGWYRNRREGYFSLGGN